MSTEIVRQVSLETILPKIPEAYHPYIMALKSDIIKELGKSDAVFGIIEAFNKAVLLKGQVVDSKADRFIGESLYDFFMRKSPNAKMGQIELAFKLGAAGEYTKRDDRGRAEFEGVNVNTLWGWWKSFNESDGKLMAQQEYNKVLFEGQTAKKPLGALFMSDKDILKYYNEWLTNTLLTGKIGNELGRIIYDQICLLKNVKTLLNTDERKEIEDKIKPVYERELKGKKYDKREPELFNILVNACEKGTATFASIGKRLALEYYFEQCKTKNQQPI